MRGFRGASWPSALGRSLALTVGYNAIFNLIGLSLVNALVVMDLP